ncbi:hypothetical protein HHL16_17475 [Pseudoflavitalea sp. G-6-1-2]|uniref:aminotransferase class IV n=1 Tax=Pseudoflavitalea sp. G-6-1-2 TaxID=2728841 RepID=UPI00146BC9F2|nr:aminotransferase class IV [Pseudoflavitalea sp. G-6-1-2]NML22678.1 hypothetical protein [Pseudoflavitalea sp. G-6-1-2]
MSQFDYYNGTFIPSGEPVFSANSRAVRYGDGLFETIKMLNGKLLLGEYHFNRLFSGLKLLKFEIPTHFTPAFISDAILALCKKNGTEKAARIRLSVLRGDGGLYDAEDPQPNLLIQCWPIGHQAQELNENGLITDIFSEARKCFDHFSHLKSNNYLPYVMGAMYAREHALNDVVLLNVDGQICETTISNIFCVKNDTIFTPPLNAGCIDGVMRRYLLANAGNFHFTEKAITADFLMNADEIFFTNAMGLRWVAKCGGKEFGKKLSVELHEQLIRPMFH